MPKIRQAVSVFIAVAVCIGYNTFQYPVVWQMMAALPTPAQNSDARTADQTRPSAQDSGTLGTGEVQGARHGNMVCKDGVCMLVPPPAPVASMPSSIPAEPQLKSNTLPALNDEFPSKAFDSPPGKPNVDAKSDPSESEPKSSETESASDESETPTSPAATESPAPPRQAEGKSPRAEKMKLVSSSSSPRAEMEESEKTPAESVLVPVERPRSGKKASEKPTSSIALSQASESAPASVRPLPRVEAASGESSADPSSAITPDLVREYRVTPAM